MKSDWAAGCVEEEMEGERWRKDCWEKKKKVKLGEKRDLAGQGEGEKQQKQGKVE